MYPSDFSIQMFTLCTKFHEHLPESASPSAKTAANAVRSRPRREAGAPKRLAATVFRREGVYNRTEKRSVTFFGKEERRNKAMRRFVYTIKNRRELSEARDDVVRVEITDSAANDHISNYVESISCNGKS